MVLPILVFMVRMTSKHITIRSEHTNHCRFYLLLTSVNTHNVQNKPQPTDLFVPQCHQMTLCYNLCHRRCYTPKNYTNPGDSMSTTRTPTPSMPSTITRWYYAIPMISYRQDFKTSSASKPHPE